jgi:hypothetical protein
MAMISLKNFKREQKIVSRAGTERQECTSYETLSIQTATELKVVKGKEVSKKQPKEKIKGKKKKKKGGYNTTSM